VPLRRPGRWLRSVPSVPPAARRVDRTLEERVGKSLEPDNFAEMSRLGRFNPAMFHSLAGRRLADRSALGHRLVAIR
jgi:hypothetical protein